VAVLVRLRPSLGQQPKRRKEAATVGRKGRVRLRKLRDELLRAHPSISAPHAAIARGAILVDGRVVTNPDSLIREGAAITLRMDEPLRGEAKLKAALDAFDIPVGDRIALDIGAAAGGFTRVLLDAGARRIYAVDAGHGQLLGSLRQDPRVISLERTNLGDLNTDLIPDEIDLVTLDLSYLALSDAVPQLEKVRLADDAHALALVKPQFELGLPAPPSERRQLRSAVAKARDAFLASGWEVPGWVESPVRGRRGSVEFLLHATRRPASWRML
jgi:23S rRNA (cytidine1920-2'-O)/16S rRNA (cytidine1409-2'-O)-methyltransferase